MDGAKEILNIQCHKFYVERFALAMASTDLVLGTPRLHSLSRVVWDFISMKMHFCHVGEGCQTLHAAAKKVGNLFSK